MSTDQITCPNCETENFAADQFCTRCGLWLQDFDTRRVDHNGTRSIAETETRKVLQKVGGDNALRALQPNHIGLAVEGSQELIIIQPQESILLGRDTGQVPSREPLIDFNDYRGYVMGVSRQHAQISKSDEGYHIMDMGSSNGTLLNDERLKPYQPYPLQDGDHITLGQLRLVFYAGQSS